MYLELSPQAVLTQLGYSISEASIKQIETIISNTNGFDKFSKHILSLIDHIKHTNAYIAMSNTNNFLKIKSESPSAELLVEFHQIVTEWSSKYNIKLEKIHNKDVYYIIGLN